MHSPGNTPETLVSVPSDLEAAMIVSALAAHDVDATTSGGFTAGFRAEAPGEVSVLVRRTDLERARCVLSELAAFNSVDSIASNQPTHEPTKGINLGVLLVVAIGISLLIRCM